MAEKRSFPVTKKNPEIVVTVISECIKNLATSEPKNVYNKKAIQI